MEGRHCLSAASVIAGLAGDVPSEEAAKESEYLSKIPHLSFSLFFLSSHILLSHFLIQVRRRASGGKSSGSRGQILPDAGSNTVWTSCRTPRSCWRYEWCVCDVTMCFVWHQMLFFFLIMCDVFVSRTTSGSLILTVRRSWRGREGTMRKRRRRGGRVLCCLDLRIHLTPLQARKKRYVYCVVIHWTNLQNILMQYHSIISGYSRWNWVLFFLFSFPFLSFPGALFVPTGLLWSQSCVPGWPELCHTGRDNTHIDSYKGVGCSGSRSERFPRNSSPRLVKAFVRFTIFSQLDVGWFRQSNYCRWAKHVSRVVFRNK